MFRVMFRFQVRINVIVRVKVSFSVRVKASVRVVRLTLCNRVRGNVLFRGWVNDRVRVRVSVKVSIRVRVRILGYWGSIGLVLRLVLLG